MEIGMGIVAMEIGEIFPENLEILHFEVLGS